MARVSKGTPEAAGDSHRSIFEEMLEGFALHEIVFDDAGNPVDYRVVEANPAFETLTGLRRSDIVGHTLREVLPELDPEWMDRYDEVAKTGRPAAFRLPSRSLAKTFDARAYLASPGVLATLFIDVTVVDRVSAESAAAEKALRRSQGHHRDLFENLTSGYSYCEMIYDDGEPIDWVHLEVNSVFEAQTGLANVAGRRASELIPAIRTTDPELVDLYERVVRTRVPERVEIHVNALDEWVDLSVYSPAEGRFAVLSDVITERKSRETEGMEREARLRALLDNAPYGAHMYELMPDDRLVLTGYNARAVEMLGTDHEAFLGKTIEEAFPGNIGTNTPDAYRRVAREGGTWSIDQYAYDAEEIAGVFEVYAFSFGPNRVSVFFRDVTDLRRAQMGLENSESNLRGTVEKLADAVRTLRALSACNEALVRAETEGQLLQEICEIAVEQGGYRMTWVGYAEPDDAHTVRPAAHAGVEQGYLDSIKITWDDAVTAQGPAGTAIKTGRPVVINSIEDDPRFLPWKTEALERGYRSVASFPLTFGDGTTIGSILFFAGAGAGFEEQELVLLSDLAFDLSFGIETLRARTARAELADRLAKSNDRLGALVREVTVAFGRVVEARDPYTSGHEERVAALARQIALEMGLGEDDAEAVEISGLVHDIGKLSVPAEILTKPSALSAVEFRLIREHSKAGYEILKGISFAWPVADIVLQHHERMDGSGYPGGLVGEAVLPLARILAVADVVEAMASHRPYRPALGLAAAIAEISSHPGLYDQAAVDACLRLYEAGAIVM